MCKFKGIPFFQCTTPNTKLKLIVTIISKSAPLDDKYLVSHISEKLTVSVKKWATHDIVVSAGVSVVVLSPGSLVFTHLPHKA